MAPKKSVRLKKQNISEDLKANNNAFNR